MAKLNAIADAGGLDLKLGLRLMRKFWGLTIVGGLAMALTIGLGTAIFTLWDTATTVSLPLPDGDRIVAIQPFDSVTQEIHRESSLLDLARWRESLRSVTDVSARRIVERTLVTPGGESGPISVAEMTASAFEVAGVQPVLGRTFVADDERGDANVVVIGFELWRTAFSFDRAVLGRQLLLDDVSYTVVGVMPKGFAFPVSHRIWTPLRTNPLDYPRDQSTEVFVFARLAPDATIEKAHAEAAALGLASRDRVAASTAHLQVRVVPYTTGVFGADARNRWVGLLVLTLAAMLLLPPCANIAILIYARAVTRREEFAARYALGATRGRIVTQIFVEVLVLAASAGVIGFLLASEFASRLSRLVLPGIGPNNVPFWFDFRPSLSTLLCMAGLVVVAAAIAGMVPGIRVTGRWKKVGLHAMGDRGSKVGLGRTWTTLLAAQLTVSIAVLPTATQMLWGILEPTLRGPGMAVDQYLTGWLVIDGDASRLAVRQSEFVRTLDDEASVSGVTLSTSPLMREPGADVEVDGGAERVSGQTDSNRVDRSFFEVFGARLRAGRAFDATDFGPGDSRAVVVNRTFAAEIAGTENALGHRLRYVKPQGTGSSAGSEPWYEIVGVVEDFPSNNHRATVYHPLLPAPGRVAFTVRAAGDAALAAAHLREVMKRSDPALRIGGLRSFGDVYREQGSVGHTLGFMLGSIVTVVLLFAVAGIYTLMAFIIAQRWREVGLRCALGAQPGRLVLDIFGRALIPLAIGAIAGSLLAAFIDSSIRVEDVGGKVIPGIVPAAAVFMMLVGTLALVGPARRAVRIDPSEALRTN